MDELAATVATGIGATACIDLWAVVRRRLFSVPLPDYALVGRWLAHMLRGKFRHDSMAAAPRVAGERQCGWIAHYLTGIAFASLLIGIVGTRWFQHPTLAPALMVGIGTVLAPFLLMQPGMGAGIAARRSPRPGTVRLQSLVTHTIFGFGLYAAGWATRSFLVA